MSFNRENYKRIREEYDSKYLKARELSEFRRHEVHASVAGVKELDQQIASVGLMVLECALLADQEKLKKIREKNKELQEQRGKLLINAGYPSDYTELKYECDLCGDTGIVDTSMCTCMRQQLVQEGLKSSGMYDLIKKQRFDNFSLDYYKQSPEVFSRMSAIYKFLHKYATTFSADSSPNIAMFGGTGLGKTHLSSAIAYTIIEGGHDVYYVSALSMFADFENKRFGNSTDVNIIGSIDRYFDCELLIIDDIGTEVSNQFTTSCLYNIINTRLNKNKKTIINTNLLQDEFRKRYWDRITSRILGEYSVMPFCGVDIRSQKLTR